MSLTAHRRNDALRRSLTIAIVLYTSSITVAMPQRREVERATIQKAAEKKGRVNGKVMSTKDSKPVDDVKVRIEGREDVQYTDKEGRYKFDDLPAQRDYIIVASKPLYENGGTRVNVLSDQDNSASPIIIKYAGVNVQQIKDLWNAFTFDKHEQFEFELGGIERLCKKVNESDCIFVREIAKQHDRGNHDKVLETLDKLTRLKQP